MSRNDAVADALRQIARFQELLGADKFRAISNDRAARAVEALPGDIAELAADRARLLEIEGIGPKIADKIAEFCTTGRMEELDELRAQVPAGLLKVMELPGLGPKTVALLWKEAGVTDLDGLRRVIADGSILKLPRMGEKAVEKIKAAVELAEIAGKRLPIGIALPIAERIVAYMLALPGVSRAQFAGSLRRGKETIGDIDVLITADDPADACERFRSMPGVRQVITAGDNRSSVRISADADLGRWSTETAPALEAPPAPGDEQTVQTDLRALPAESWGATLMYFTGSKEHNVRLRERALKMGYTLNEYGLFPNDDDPEPPHKRGITPVASRTEEEIYRALGLREIPPELREGRAEIEAFEIGGRDLPAVRLIETGDIKAELHAHTTASDGRLSIEELAERAKQRGFHTIAVTDHSKSSVIAGGLSPERLLEHIDAVRSAAKKIKGITLLCGSEVDILSDGRLDYDDDLLRKLDVVVASPHAALSQDPEKATARLVRAVSHPLVHVLGHPTGRLIDRRAGLSPDMTAIFGAAKEHGVALEINAHWLRLDLRDVHVRGAADAGCLIAINCDVHAPEDFDNLRFGVATARRGWLRAESCVNTWSAARLHQWLAKKR